MVVRETLSFWFTSLVSGVRRASICELKLAFYGSYEFPPLLYDPSSVFVGWCPCSPIPTGSAGVARMLASLRLLAVSTGAVAPKRAPLSIKNELQPKTIFQEVRVKLPRVFSSFGEGPVKYVQV